jgi:hypothetical protein
MPAHVTAGIAQVMRRDLTLPAAAGLAATDSAGVSGPTTLPAVTVTARNRATFLRQEISQRIRLGGGYISDSLKLAKLPQLWMAFMVPNATVTHLGGRGWTVTVTRPAFAGQGLISCVPSVWLDDNRAEFEQLAMVAPEDLAVLEFHSRVASVPLRYGGSARSEEYANWGAQQAALPSASRPVDPRRNRASTDTTLTRGDCGVVLAWTKAFLNVGDPRRPK